MILILTLVEDGLIGTISNGILAIFPLTFVRFVIGLFVYAQEQPEQKALGHKEREWKDASICYPTYDVCIKGLTLNYTPQDYLTRLCFDYSTTVTRHGETVPQQSAKS